jgi:DNA topoisomerase VI subunit B
VTAPALERQVFATPRAAEFFEVRAPQAQTGQPSDSFGAVIVKELADNALDAAETAGVPPEVEITVRADGALQLVTVANNGPGMPPELIERILDYGVLVSDKSAYRSPTRGLQGTRGRPPSGSRTRSA